MAYPLPRNDDALKAMVIQFINASNGNLTILGLTSAQVLDLTAAVTEFDIKLVDKYVRAVDAKAATAAGLVMVWSTMRLEMIRGCESNT